MMYPYESCPTRILDMFTGEGQQCHRELSSEAKREATPEEKQKRKEYDALNRAKKAAYAQRIGGL
jgi:hypothetical protein